MNASEFDLRTYYDNFTKNVVAAAKQHYFGGPDIDALDCQLIHDFRINARAVKVSKTQYKYLIQICDGLISELTTIFLKCIVSPDFPYLKLPPRKGIVDQHYNGTLFRMLMEHSLGFVALHEAFHVINGHLALMASVGSAEMMDESELEDNTPQPLSYFDLQTLEINADATAAVFLASRVVEIAKNFENFPQEQNNACYGSPDIAIEIMLFSIFCFFGATGYRIYDPAEVERSKKHPPTAVRQISIVQALNQFTSTRIHFQGHLTAPVGQIAMRAQAIWSTFAASSAADRETLKAQLNDTGALGYWIKLNQNWGSNLRGILEPIKHGGIRRDKPNAKNGPHQNGISPTGGSAPDRPASAGEPDPPTGA